MKQSELNELAQVVKDFSKGDMLVAAIPGEIRNSGKMEKVIKTTVGHIPSQKSRTFIYRGEYRDYRKALQEATDEIINEIHSEIVQDATKDDKSL